MNILFLDIDGVLNSGRTFAAFGAYPLSVRGADRRMFDEVAISLVRGVVRAAGAKIILSSAWRLTEDLQEMADGLDLPIIGKTPHIPEACRGAEIDDWMRLNPGVERYAILEDLETMLPHQEPYVVRTSPQDGLCYADAAKLATLLGVHVLDARPAPKVGW